MQVQQLLQTRWWDWLKLPAKEWPTGEPQPDEQIVEQERREGIVSSLPCKKGQTDWYDAFSHNYDKIARVLAWVLRFVKSCRTTRENQGSGKGVQWETMFAEKWVIIYVESCRATRQEVFSFVRVLFAEGPKL